ncbi:hypothetical protein BELL_0352g00100 [Botrytis elliptica]|uniref:3-beta hydroxysteroid dehydrogenase/isomerase domain-containing protein n=1 Tax=Botrytis elliptica TaxID=278938 RepID=A0A4Z1JIJ7_9HELO|nr:hypothetical protein BELL_0352g00100 [Botrytis elliptica]
MLEPTINGTVGILKAIKQSTPSVKRIVITSSIAAVMNPFSAPAKYTTEDWNPVTKKQALKFIRKKLPSIGLATINPPAILGPVLHYLKFLAEINTSNTTIADLMQGKWKNKALSTFTKPWVNVRDVILAYMNTLEISEAARRRFLLNKGFVTNTDYIAIAKNNSIIKDKLPKTINKEKITDFEVDIELVEKILGIKFRSLEENVFDIITSL